MLLLRSMPSRVMLHMVAMPRDPAGISMPTVFTRAQYEPPPAYGVPSLIGPRHHIQDHLFVVLINTLVLAITSPPPGLKSNWWVKHVLFDPGVNKTDSIPSNQGASQLLAPRGG